MQYYWLTDGYDSGKMFKYLSENSIGFNHSKTIKELLEIKKVFNALGDTLNVRYWILSEDERQSIDWLYRFDVWYGMEEDE